MDVEFKRTRDSVIVDLENVEPKWIRDFMKSLLFILDEGQEPLPFDFVHLVDDDGEDRTIMIRDDEVQMFHLVHLDPAKWFSRLVAEKKVEGIEVDFLAVGSAFVSDDPPEGVAPRDDPDHYDMGFAYYASEDGCDYYWVAYKLDKTGKKVIERDVWRRFDNPTSEMRSRVFDGVWDG